MLNRIFLVIFLVCAILGLGWAQNDCEFPANLNTTIGQFSWFYVGAAEICFNSIPFNQTIASETILQLRNLLQFYAFVDINKDTGPPFNQRSDLELYLDAVEGTFFFRDFDFHIAVAQAFSTAADAHTMYSIPSSYRNIVNLRPFRLSSRYNNVTDEQEIYVHSLTTLRTTPSSQVASLAGLDASPYVGRRILAIQGVDILTWMELFANRLGEARDPSIRLNLAILFFHSCRIGQCDLPSLTETYTFENANNTGTEDFTIPSILLSLTVHENDSFVQGLQASSEEEFAKRVPKHERKRTPHIGSNPFEQNQLLQDLLTVPEKKEKHLEEKRNEFLQDVRKKPSEKRDNKNKRERKQYNNNVGLEFLDREIDLIPSISFEGFNFSDPTETVRCAFLTNERNTTYVVLKIGSFSGSVNGSSDLFGEEFIKTMVRCLREGAAYDRLLIDVRRNGGGFISLAALAQLAIVPEWDTRTSNDLFSPYDLRKTALTDAFIAEMSGDSYLDPDVIPAAQFPAATRNTLNAGWYSPTVEDIRGGVEGNYTPKAYFANPTLEFPDAHTYLLNNLLPRKYNKIIAFTDGICGSSCSIFLSRLQYHGKVSVVSAGGKYPSKMDTSCFGGGNSIGSWNNFVDFVLDVDGTNQALGQTFNIRKFPTSADCGFLLREFFLGNEDVPRELQSYPADCHIWEWDHLRDQDIESYYHKVSLLFDNPTCTNPKALGTQFGEEPLSIFTKYGAVRGYVDGPLRKWLGIPYAKPPVNESRWTLPEPPNSWSDTFEATIIGAVCYQYNSELEVYEGSEDCLTLNVFAPKTPYSRTYQGVDSNCEGSVNYTVVKGDWLSKIARRFGVTWQQIYQWNSHKIEDPNLIYPGQVFLIKCPRVPRTTSLRPVLVYLHPGDFNSGSSRDDPVDKLAEIGDAVVVTFNYRLGVFGFLSFPNVEPNLGLKDQQLALKWVKENIEFFGGDPDRITIFGGSSVVFQLLMSESQGLFQNAIIQSAYHWINPPFISAKLLGARFSRHVGCLDPSGSLPCLKGKSKEELYGDNSEIKDIQISSPRVTVTYSNDTTPSELSQRLLLDLIDKILDAFESLGYERTSNTDDNTEPEDIQLLFNQIFVPVIGRETDFRYDVLPLFKAGNFNKNVSIILGHNKQEYDSLISFDTRLYENDYEEIIEERFKILSDETIEIIKNAYEQKGRTDGWDEAIIQSLSDAYFNCPLDAAARFIVKNTRKPVYRYLLTQDSPNLLDDLEPAHGLERAYIFKNPEADIPNSIDTLDATDEQLADDIISWWSEFSFSGNPTANKPPSRRWKPFVTNGPPSERNLAKDLSRKPRHRNPLPKYVEMKPDYYPNCPVVWKKVLSSREFYASGKWVDSMFKSVFGGDGVYVIEAEAPTPTPFLLDSDGDRIPDIYETNTGVYVDPTDTGTNPNSRDTDNDGILDGDEVYGTEDGLDLPGMGCNPLRYDILLEHDWMDDSVGCGPHSHRPPVAMLDAITTAFSNSPVVNVDGTTGINVIHDYGQGGVFDGGNLVNSTDGSLTGNGVFGADFNVIKLGNFDNNRMGYFHYILHVHSFFNSTWLGNAEIVGNDVVCSLGCSWSDTELGYVNLMHELGHNLGLRHGGNSNCNYKPNYNSIMNYRYSNRGVAVNCSSISSDHVLDYSSGTRNPINESNIVESVGVCGGVPVDINNSGSIEDNYSQNLNPTEDFNCGGSFTVLEDFDDWSNLVFTGISDADKKRSSREQIFCMEQPRSSHRPAGWSPDEK